MKTMRKLTLGATLTIWAALATAGTAQAVVLITPQGQSVGGIWQRWADQSRMPTVQMRVVFSTSPSDPNACTPADAQACFWTGPNEAPTVWIGTSWRGDVRLPFYHELGHVFDWYYLTDHDRHQWETWAHTVGERWAEDTIPGGGASDEFANDYATCATTGSRHGWFPTPAMCRMIRQAHYHDTPGAFALGTVPR